MHLCGVISHFYLSLVHSRFRAATYCILHARQPIIHSVCVTQGVAKNSILRSAMYSNWNRS